MSNPAKIECAYLSFSVVLYTAALTRLDRYDGMCIKAHPVMAACIQEVIKDQPFRLPIVHDRRNKPNEVGIWDLQSTFTEIVVFTDLAAPSGSEQF